MKIIFYIILPLFLLSCENCPSPLKVDKNYKYKWNKPIQVSSIDEAMKWCSDNIEYKNDKEVWNQSDYWQTPQETYDKRTGDCEDYCILFMQLVYELGYESELKIILKTNDNYHAIVKVENIYYDVQINAIYNKLENYKNYKSDGESYTYSEALWYTVAHHRGRVQGEE